MQFVYWTVVISLCACGSVDSKKPDAQQQQDACIAETDTEFCAGLIGACESHTGMDNCGTQRTVDCGACAAGQGCVVGECKTPVCSSFNYARTNISAFTQASIEDSIGGATWDGRVILYVKTDPNAGVCQNYQLIVADEMTPGSGTYTQSDATTNFETLGLFVGQEAYSVTADGLTIVTTTLNRKTLVSTKRSALGVVDFATPSTAMFDAINLTIGASDTGYILSPNISADGLELFYYVGGYSGADVARNGTYDSVRSSTTVPFPAGTKMPAPINDGTYGALTGVSSDRLAVFVFYNYVSRIFTRRSTSQPFTNPNAPADPPSVSGWSHKPLADCAKLIAMYSPGGCQNEDVVLLTRQ